MYRQLADNLEKDSGTAYYQQISEILMQRIREGAYLPGSKLPAESDLGRQFGVNRHTAREALKQLKSEGVLFSVKGSGTFVAEQKIRYRVSKTVRFSTSVQEAGFTPGIELLGTSLSEADEGLAQQLGVNPGAEVLELEMLRSVNGIPFMVATSRLPAARVPGLERRMHGAASLYALLKEAFGIEATRSESVFEAVLPGERERHLLQIPAEVPLLLVRSVGRDQDGRVIEYCETYMRGDLGSMVVNFA